MVHDVFLKNSFLRHSGHPPCLIYHWSYPWMILYDVSMNSSVLLWTSKYLWCSLSMIYLWTVLRSSSYSWYPVWAMNSSVLFKHSWYCKCFEHLVEVELVRNHQLLLLHIEIPPCVWYFFRIVCPSPIPSQSMSTFCHWSKFHVQQPYWRNPIPKFISRRIEGNNLSIVCGSADQMALIFHV
jgi:hypothetical protein